MRGFRFIKALVRYAIYGHFQKTDYDNYVQRLNACNKCHELNRSEWTCNICGCYLDKKAKWSTETCPYNKW